MRNENDIIQGGRKADKTPRQSASGRGAASMGGESGSIMMEYVIVIGAIAIALVVFMNTQFYSITDGFGPLGQGLVAFYQRTLGGLSLPIP